jgi:predicted RNA-binding protein YlqC (UPF0109 family)
MRTTPQPEYLAYHLLYKIVSSMVEHPDKVSIQTISTVSDTTFSIAVDPEDLARFKGDKDRNLEALRTILEAMVLCSNRKFHVTARRELAEAATGQEHSASEAVA